ncbi:hypothetical protein EJ03DRAFT_348045 [Teratosphaeria nubilosa]|uniref:Transglutaminase-like domain-containing protein n=1 Tax=Teratosphaeria nubilosa TaxID=161662 RepID=A0A6G1LJ55_9PEZI|nr:hypothetical protein EJ03DRAFT_348045 [Teratosphaeria nubilosa]
MADEQSMSVKDRIAQLRLNQIARVPEKSSPASTEQVVEGTTWTRAKRPPPPRPPPPPPARPSAPSRPNSTGVPTAQNGFIADQPEGDHDATTGAVKPPLPSRTSASQSLSAPHLPPRKTSEPSPALPPRRPSETPSSSDCRLSRRVSSESISSVATGQSSLSGVSTPASITSGRSVKAPVFDPNALPALPPRRTEEEKRAYYDSGYQKNGRRPLKSTYSSPNVLPKPNGTTAPPTPRRPSTRQAQASPSQVESAPEPPVRQLEPAPAPPVRPPPPQLPSRNAVTPQPTARQRPPPVQPPRPQQSALTMGFGGATPKPTPPLPSRPNPTTTTNGTTPPPIPTSTRPDLAALQASKPKPNTSFPPQPLCLHCRDFTTPDHHATQFPRQTPPNQSLPHLAHALTSPFPSPTDKARTIFTWLHHNILYDTTAFFSGRLAPSTPHSTLTTGLAVCEGYAGLFAALAMKSGLEALVIGGHGKGYGYTPLKPGDPIPPRNAGGHAWNAVYLPDAGGWKLLDACWGAGHICGNNNLYKQEFAPDRFTQSNDDFGLDHFPSDPTHQFRSDGQAITWAQYITTPKRGSGAEFFAGYTAAEGLSEPSFRPASNPIILAHQGPTTRFSFQKICPHWDPVGNGRGEYCLYTLAVEALEGREGNHLPFRTDGEVWWCDVPTGELGTAGQSVKVLVVTSGHVGGRGK